MRLRDNSELISPLPAGSAAEKVRKDAPDETRGEAHSERMTAYYAIPENREAARERTTAFFAAHPEAGEARSERMAVFYAAHPEAREAQSERRKASAKPDLIILSKGTSQLAVRDATPRLL